MSAGASAARRLSLAVAALMALQGALGLARPDLYVDPEWILAAWFGNDAFTLAVAAPLTALSTVYGARGSARGRLAWIGLLGFGVYNYAFYLFGAGLNAFFPLYVALFVLALSALILAVRAVDADAVADAFTRRTPVRLVGGYFVFLAIALGSVWLVLWARFVFAGGELPPDPDAFQVVASLDLALIVPALAAGGSLLWRRRPWGFVLASAAGIGGTLYLAVLSVNSWVAVRRGLVEGTGELPLWASLGGGTALATGLLLSNVRPSRAPPETDPP